MNVLITSVGFGTLEARACITEWRASHHIVEEMPLERIIGYLRFDSASSLALVDAIVCMADTGAIAPTEDDVRRLSGLDFPLEKALALAEDVRNLPDVYTMQDGRKWKKDTHCDFHDTQQQRLVVSAAQVPARKRIPSDLSVGGTP